MEFIKVVEASGAVGAEGRVEDVNDDIGSTIKEDQGDIKREILISSSVYDQH